MGAVQKQHTQPGLADSAADGIGQFSIQKHPVIGEGSSVLAARLLKLFLQGLLIHAYPHAGDL